MEEFFEFDIPDSFLSQLNEFSGGGYMLFILDAEKNVRIYGKVDEVTSESHLNTQIKGWGRCPRRDKQTKHIGIPNREL